MQHADKWSCPPFHSFSQRNESVRIFESIVLSPFYKIVEGMYLRLNKCLRVWPSCSSPVQSQVNSKSSFCKGLAQKLKGCYDFFFNQSCSRKSHFMVLQRISYPLSQKWHHLGTIEEEPCFALTKRKACDIIK